MWTGIATVAAGVLVSNVGQSGMGFGGSLGARLGALAMAGVSPAFVTFLLFKVCSRSLVEVVFACLQLNQVSGIPLSENKYDKRYGDRKDYQEWKKVGVVCL